MEILGFDLETTSVDVSSTMPVQMSLVQSTGPSIHRVMIDTLCDPCCRIEAGASEVHGIYADNVKGAPDAWISAWILETAAASVNADLLVSYNGTTFDSPIMARLLGRPFLPGIPHLDVLDLAYRYLPDMPVRKLGVVYEHAFGEPLEGAHAASIDVIATIRIAHWFSEQQGMSLLDLSELMAIPKPYEIMPIGKHRGTPISQVPRGWAQFMRRNATDMRPDLKATVDAILA